MNAMIERNLKLYFRNRSGVVFSLLGAMISFVLYLVFLKQNMQTSWQAVPHAKTLLDLWLIGGTLAITGMTTTLSSLAQQVVDRERQTSLDLQLTDAGPLKLQVSYLLSATLIGSLMQLIMLIVMLAYFHWTDQLALTHLPIIELGVLMVSSALVATLVNAILLQLVRSLSNLSKLESIVGTASGFLVGTYLPIGSLPTAAQQLVKLTPGSYVAARFRQLLMSSALKTAFPVEQTRLHFERLMGIRLKWSTLLTPTATTHIISMILIGALLIVMVPQLVTLWHTRQLRASR